MQETKYTKVNTEADYIRITPDVYRLIALAHRGQLDKGGQPYIQHLVRVSQAQTDLRHQLLALVHDIIEDTETTFDELYEVGFDFKDVEVIKAMTKDDSESYEEYIERLSQNQDAIPIKIADLKDNMNFTRLKKINQEILDRSMTKYFNAYWKLQNMSSLTV